MQKLIKLSKENRQYMISEIQSYFSKERDEELGELASGLILDFFIEKLAPEFYNQGVNDSYLYMNDRVEDLLGIQKLSNITKR
ncbi:DUF2164 domain-containing protein [Desulforamulus aquiferis]|uniref:DUF2164 domain-containing protein n=1 Tax=Desulforamulus aquiferis TaxID=1397668 RepID=A0AAW7Z8N9_9FIRM|nr:DUF2164 domain-containing protein [Desulforamulus aquiferis]MDO7785752.1 DUF2164 domain-containing protein [Desulforamulus aquiferis]RYD06766.1 hypothetical protein N752_03560 [Desulforamulus aquiferis]